MPDCQAVHFAVARCQSRVILPPTYVGPNKENGMRLIRVALLVVLACATTARLQASPHVIIHDPEGSGTPTLLFAFTFSSDINGGGLLTLTNSTGSYWYNMYVFTPAPTPPASITCGGDSFAFCQVQAGQMGYFSTIVFYGPPGILNGETFYIDLGDNGWAPNAQFEAFENYQVVPEPASLLLFASG